METKTTRLSTLVKRYNINLPDLCSILSGLGFETKESPYSVIPNEIVSQIENELDVRGILLKGSETIQDESALMPEDTILSDDIKRKVATIIRDIQDETIPSKSGKWVLMAKISKVLDENMLYYKEYGYDRLKLFLDENEYLEIFTDSSKSVPRHFVQSKISTQSVSKKDCNSIEAKHEDKSDQIYSHENYFGEGIMPNLLKWAWINDWPSVIHKLKKLALHENWGDYVNPKTGVEVYPVLDSYFSNTFIKCWRENKVLLSKDCKYAAFNTGLVDYKYKDIFAIFSASNKKEDPFPWHFSDFCVEGEEKYGKILVSKFNSTPRRAEYFKEKSDMLYDTSQEPPKLDSIHIIVENIDRLPYDFIKMNAPKDFDLLSPDDLHEKTKDMEKWDKEEFLRNYYDSLSDAVKADSRSLRRMFRDIKEAMDIAIKRVEWNYKSAIPMYWPRGNKMCFFLPLCLLDDDKVDTALVVNKTESGRYQGETIYRLDWAYKCARLVCRPDSDWLSLDKIQNNELAMEEDVPELSK